jgi:hypothetical protein
MRKRRINSDDHDDDDTTVRAAAVRMKHIKRIPVVMIPGTIVDNGSWPKVEPKNKKK